MQYPLLDKVNSAAGLKALQREELPGLAEELRHFMQENTRSKAGHIRASLGVVELTIALHYHFDTPRDILIWDVGHQAYAHKILTGRRHIFSGNRMRGGISGFTRRAESEYDAFGAGHSSTSVSAAVGFASGARLRKQERQHIAVIGDGAFTGGQCFEALNYAGEQQLNLTVVLNDNQSSIDENVGALARFGNYRALCEALHFQYYEVADGHHIPALLDVLAQSEQQQGPRLIHLRTEKGRGYVNTPASAAGSPTYQDHFATQLMTLAAADDKIVALSPAMLSGSGLDAFGRQYAGRTFDTGITEQHAVTMAAALAADGFKPLCHLYSTFAQRAYDQIIHDVALQELPVVFCLDRAGLAGEDGPTHHGAFDTSFLNAIPGLCLGSPLTAQDFTEMLKAAFERKGPTVLRYPKDDLPMLEDLGRDAVRQVQGGEGVALISYGSIGAEAQRAVQETGYAHYNLAYLKPFPASEIRRVLERYAHIITVEENSRAGGLGESCAAIIAVEKIATQLHICALPDHFVEHGSRKELLQLCGLDAESIRQQLERTRKV